MPKLDYWAKEAQSGYRSLRRLYPNDEEGVQLTTKMRRLRPYCCATSLCLAVSLFVVLGVIVNHDVGHAGGVSSRTSHVTGLDGMIGVPMPIIPAGIGCDRADQMCICSNTKKHSHSEGFTCWQWTYEVGDVVLVGAPKIVNADSIMDRMVSAFEASEHIHTGIIVRVPPAGSPQTGDNIIVGEAVGDSVSNSTLRYLVERYPWGGIHVMRIDSERFPRFREKQDFMSSWAMQRFGEPFNRFLLMYGVNQLARGSTILIDPDCHERHRALDMFHNGGPHGWFCGMYVSWVLGMAGGINFDYGQRKNCTLPRWTIKNLQSTPGDLYRTPIWDDETRYANCGHGCFVGWPQGVPEDGTKNPHAA